MDYKSVRLIFFSYLIIILLGGILLWMPFATTKPLTFLDTLFTSASATCVTGLIVVSTSKDFTFWGELIVLILIQIGGIGYMSFVTLIYLLLKKELNINEKQVAKESLDTYSVHDIGKFLKQVFIIAFGTEAIIALILWARFSFDYPVFEALWYGIFHAITSFNNAGFALFTDSIISYNKDFIIITTLSISTIIGGLGYLVMLEIRDKYSKRNFRFSLHSKLVLWTTLFLLVSGTLFFLSLEWSNPKTFGNFNLFDKLLNSFFLSVNFRTSGFNSVDLSGLTDSSLFFSTIYMMIGCGPGGTGGGIKVTTFVVLVIAALFTIRQSNQQPRIFSRTIPYDVINRSLAILLVASFYVVTSAILLAETQSQPFLKLLFEVVSAFATVGVSVGDGGILSLSALFDDFGKINIILLMIAGRLGIIAFTLMLVGQAKISHIKYPEGRIIL